MDIELRILSREEIFQDVYFFFRASLLKSAWGTIIHRASSHYSSGRSLFPNQYAPAKINKISDGK